MKALPDEVTQEEQGSITCEDVHEDREAAMALAWVPLCCLTGVPGAMSDQCLVWQIRTLCGDAAA